MKTLKQAVMILLFFIILTGLVYPLLITGIAQLAFPKQAYGSLITQKGKVVGSELIGQLFTSDSYFQGRPSATDYQSTNNAGGYNLGPASSNLIATVAGRVDDIRSANGLSASSAIPPDMVLASASGLDPDISVSNAFIQAERVSKNTGISTEEIHKLIERLKETPFAGLWETEKVNVLKLNLQLDGMKKR